MHFMTIKDASIWASNLLGKDITPSNIAYLVQYGIALLQEHKDSFLDQWFLQPARR